MTGYRGRFAPTPSGPLHFGSIVAAAGSYADALAQGGEWHLRIDDLDPPRVATGATESILTCLEAFGFEWTGPVVHQSRRREAYEDALASLRRHAHTYPCTCSRAEIAAAGLAGPEGPRYPGTCRTGVSHPERPRACRIEVPDGTVTVCDRLQGDFSQNLASTVGDFVLRRADGVFSYHLACVVDDAAAGFTHVVRGADLLASTPRQIFLAHLLNLPDPEYLHLPVAVNELGEKLSKQSRAGAVDPCSASRVLVRALSFLGQPVPRELSDHAPGDVWRWTRENWSRALLPHVRQKTPEIAGGRCPDGTR